MSSPENTSPRGCNNQSSNNGIERELIANTVVQHITTDAEFDNLHEDWSRLHSSCQSASLFNCWYWNRLWWKFYGDIGELFIVVVRVDGVTQGIAPFYRCQTRALKLRRVLTLRFIGSGGDTSPDDLGVLHDKDFEDVVIESVCQYVFDASLCTRLQLTDIGDDSRLLNTLLSMATKDSWAAPIKQTHHRRVDTLPTSIRLFESRLSRNARKQRKRRRQQLLRAGKNVRFETCTTRTQVGSTFSELLRIHHLRHAGKGGSDSFNSESYRSFHLAVMEHALEKNELRLMKLIVDDKIIGIEYAFHCKDTLWFFQTGFDPEFQHLSPGHLLMMETIDRAIQDGATGLDLLKGNYGYKQRYARQIKTTIDLDLWRSPLIALITRSIRSLRSEDTNENSTNASSSNATPVESSTS